MIGLDESVCRLVVRRRKLERSVRGDMDAREKQPLTEPLMVVLGEVEASGRVLHNSGHLHRPPDHVTRHDHGAAQHTSGAYLFTEVQTHKVCNGNLCAPSNSFWAKEADFWPPKKVKQNSATRCSHKD